MTFTASAPLRSPQPAAFIVVAEVTTVPEVVARHVHGFLPCMCSLRPWPCPR